MQNDLTRADLARRPHIVKYTGGKTPGFIGFKTAESAEAFKARATEYGPVEETNADDLPNGFWRPLEMWEQRGINGVISLTGGKLWVSR
ncbi:hypothetical protein [Paracoccus sp. (in: a-proteobacteria)]|uniref:hypothetical protein n=1 Tax=Paracoccus sp. TaxID=267 RepID=UPI0026DF2AC6|nr:hypothetical protein [Paracoccus sp. (in: a-proteobacteria)]MDO5648924.1 hypothetical protein [Paracoccus sp. (in: a-proteobacteria)]